MLRFACQLLTVSAAVFLSLSVATLRAAAEERISIDAAAPSTPFPHFWEQMFGSGRASLALRESYRDDLRAVRAITDFRYVRFHAILHDENGVYTEDEHGNPVYNFSYVDQIYDGLLKTASALSSKSASCRRNSPSTPTPSIPSGTSRTSPHRSRLIAGTTSSRPRQTPGRPLRRR